MPDSPFEGFTFEESFRYSVVVDGMVGRPAPARFSTRVSILIVFTSPQPGNSSIVLPTADRQTSVDTHPHENDGLIPHQDIRMTVQKCT